jgi:DNA invertase Pin-like site-specific DNA recombinase
MRVIPVVGYIRVSATHGRAGESFYSPSDQRRAIEALAKREGLEVIEWFEELDESGRNRERPLWNMAIEMVETGHAQGVAVLNYARYARDFVDARLSVELVEKAGGQLYSASEKADGITRDILFLMAEYYCKSASAGFDSARRNAIKRGVSTAKAPFGYVKDESKRLVPDPVKALIVKHLFEMKADGLSDVALLNYVKEQGFQIGRTTIRAMLRNDVYLGIVRWGDAVNEEAHEPLVSRELFSRAQVPRPAKITPNPNKPKARSLLRGLARCGCCGGALAVVGYGTAKRPFVYYCGGRNKGGCDSRARVRVDVLDAYVNEFVMATLMVEDSEAEVFETEDRLTEAMAEVTDARHAHAELLANTKLVTILGMKEYTTLLENSKARVEMARWCSRRPRLRVIS